MTGRIEDLDLQFPKKVALALIVSDDRSVGRIVTDEDGITIGPAAAAFDSLLNGARANERNVLRRHAAGEVSQRNNVVHNPNPASVRCQNEIAFARLNREITNCHRWKMIALELRPPFSTIDRNPQTELGSEEKQIGLFQVFLDDVRVTPDGLRVFVGN